MGGEFGLVMLRRDVGGGEWALQAPLGLGFGPFRLQERERLLQALEMIHLMI